jgi:hypothetical protein
MKQLRILLLAGALLAAACETMPVGGVSTPTGTGAIPSTPLDLGDWRRASAAQVLSAFQQNIAARYSAGLALSAVSADLRRNDFNCAPPAPATDPRGDPPEQVCRRTTTANGCTHTWQVHLFDNSGRVERARGLYDRRCGNDGLLGGPS